MSDCSDFYLHQIEVLQELKTLIDTCLKSGLIDAEAVSEINRLAASLKRAKLAEFDCYAEKLKQEVSG